MSMRLLAALTRGWNCSVETHHAGALVYREGNREYTFPAYEEDGMMVLVGVPTSERVRYFFNWYSRHPVVSSDSLQRIMGKIRERLFQRGIEFRLFERNEAFEYYPELFEHRARALDQIAWAGCEWMRDYSSIDLLHEDYGLEVCGIRRESHVAAVIEAMQRGFPHWHHLKVFAREFGCDEGWSVSVSMFCPRTCTPGQFEGDWLE